MPVNVFGQDESAYTAKPITEEIGNHEGFVIEELERTESQPPAIPVNQQTTKPPVKPVQTTKPTPTKTKPAEQVEPEAVVEPEVVKKAEEDMLGEFFKEGEADTSLTPPKAEGEEEPQSTEELQESENQWTNYSKELYKIGVFEPMIDEEGNETTQEAKTPEEFRTLFEEQSNAKGAAWLDGFLTKFGDDRKDLFHAVYVSGVDPAKYFATASAIESMKGLDLENEVNQERVVREFYKRNGLSQDKIDTTVQRLKDISELKNQADNFHPLLVDQDEDSLLQQQEEAKERQLHEQKQDNFYRQSVTKVLQDKLKSKDFDGISVTQAVAQKTFDFLTKKNWKTPNGKLLTDFDVWMESLNRPENHSLKVKLALLATSNLDLSKVKQKAVVQESDSLFQTLKRKDVKTNSKKIQEAQDSFNSSIFK